MAAALQTQAASLCGAPQAAWGRRAAAPVRLGSLRTAAPSFQAQRAQPLSARRTVTAAAAAEATTPPSVAASTSNEYAVVEVGGIQLLVEEGRWYSCNKLDAVPGSKIQLGRVLAHKDSKGTFAVGQPYLESVTVEAEVLEELKGPKVLVYKMKPKKHYRKMRGHRQDLTKFKITKISA